jgi:hypothetical protein
MRQRHILKAMETTRKEKIKKLRALARSPNQHEAALALKKAQAMEAKFGTGSLRRAALAPWRQYGRSLGAPRAGAGAERVNRRAFLGTLSACAASLSFDGLAQTPRPLIGRLLTTSKEATEPWRDAFLEGMRELGYVEGRDYTLEDRYAEGSTTRFPAPSQRWAGMAPWPKISRPKAAFR